MIIEPSSNDDRIFESHLLDRTHLPVPEQTSKLLDIEGIRERVFDEKNKDFGNSADVNSTLLEESSSPEENNDPFTEYWEETPIDDEDFLQAAALENARVVHEFEASGNQDETAAHEFEEEVSEAGMAQTEESAAHRKKIEESRLDREGDKVNQEAESEVEEGVLKKAAGDEAARQVNAELDQVNAETSAREDAALINGKLQETRCSVQLGQSFTHQCNEFVRQNDSKRNENISLPSSNSSSGSKMTIDKDKNRDDRLEHVKQVIQVKIEQLNHLDSQDRVDFHSINEAIRHELKRKSFENVYDENGVFLREDEANINQLTQDILDYKHDHPEENLSKIVHHRIAVWLSNKNLHEKNSQGDLVPISLERQNELVTILSSAVVIEIVNQLTHSQKMSQEDKAQDGLTSTPDVTGKVRQQQFGQMHGKRIKLDSLESNGTILKENSMKKYVIEIKKAKSLDESHLDIIDQVSRIFQMITSKEIIASEITHLDQEHVIVVIDIVRIKKLKGMR